MNRIKDARDLEPGDHILVQSGRIERVRSATTIDAYGGYEIHTDASDILTSAPCPVKVIEVVS